MTGAARYDDVADFYAAGWTDDLGDSVSAGLLRLLGPVAGQQILEIACGHGRISRELARRGARVTGADISQALIAKARAAEEAEPLGIRYLGADAAGPGLLAGTGRPDQAAFDAVVCSFGLSDIDDLDGVIGNVRRRLRPGGRFVCSLLHPCFPGGPAFPGPGRPAAPTATRAGGGPAASCPPCAAMWGPTTGRSPPT
jgi:SAM-dependent methyltransferase